MTYDPTPGGPDGPPSPDDPALAAPATRSKLERAGNFVGAVLAIMVMLVVCAIVGGFVYKLLAWLYGF